MSGASTPRRGLLPSPELERELPNHVREDGESERHEQTHGPLVVSHWLKYGRHLVAVSTLDGARVGWVDLASGERSVLLPELEAAFNAAVAAAADSPSQYIPRRAFADAVPA